MAKNRKIFKKNKKIAKNVKFLLTIEFQFDILLVHIGKRVQK